MSETDTRTPIPTVAPTVPDGCVDGPHGHLVGGPADGQVIPLPLDRPAPARREVDVDDPDAMASYARRGPVGECWVYGWHNWA